MIRHSHPAPRRTPQRRRRAFGVAAVLATAGATAVAMAVTAGAATAAPTTTDTSPAAVPAAASAAPLGTNWYASAPYFMPEDNNPPDISEVMAATGQKAFQLAFILAGSGCTAAWNGTTPIDDDPAVDAAISTIRAAGGDVSVSQGGYGGTKLGQVCSSPQAEAAALQKVIDRYDLHAIDFDLEEPEYENLTAVDNEVGAAQILQQTNPGLYVSITMPGTPSGTGYFGENVLKTAKGLGFTPANFSIMPFDNGISGAAQTTAALTAFNGVLQKDLGWDEATAWAHEGISGMNGRSDTGEMFTVQDFHDILAFAQQKKMARFTYWSVNRDQPCPASEVSDRTWGDCSSTDAAPWSYTAVTTAFAQSTTPTEPTPPTSTPTPTPTPTATSTATPTPTPTPTPTSTPTPPTTPTLQCAVAYTSATAYSGGAEVSSAGHNWTAKWWTQGQAPGSDLVWTDDGPCAGSATPPPANQCGAAWNASTAYSGGAKVSYEGDQWTAKWWTQGQTPGDADSPWTDDGACVKAAA